MWLVASEAAGPFFKIRIMKRSTILLYMMILLIAASAQDNDHNIVVKKKQALSISPDSMYFNSHVARSFTIYGIPTGYHVKGSFDGGSIHIHNNALTITPVYVYKNSEISDLERKYFSGFIGIDGDVLSATLILDLYDDKNTIVSSITKKCTILHESHVSKSAISAVDLNPGAKGIIRFGQKDSIK